MMKKLLGILFAVMLLTSAALAEGGVWSLYARTDAEPYLLGSAVPVSDGVLLSVDGLVLDGMYVFASHMGQEVPVTHAVGLGDGMIAVFADGVTGQLPEAADDIPNTVYVTSASKGGTVQSSASVTTTVVWRGVHCPLIASDASLTPGALVTDGEGRLVGMIAAAWGEGRGRYVVLPAANVADGAKTAAAGSFAEDALFYDSIPDMPDMKPAAAEDPRWIANFTAEADGAALTVDWSAAGLTLGEDEMIYVLFMDSEHAFFSYLPVEQGAESVTFYAAPERMYFVWVQRCAKDDFSSDVSIDAVKMVSTGSAPAFDDYAYRDDAFYVGFVPAGSEPNAVKADMAGSVTVEMIHDPETEFVLQAVSAYEVTEEISCTMQVVLETPDNMALLLDSGYIFMPDIMHEDVWNCSLEALFGTYETFSGFILEGEYTLTYYFDGLKVNSLTFTVE